MKNHCRPLRLPPFGLRVLDFAPRDRLEADLLVDGKAL